MIESGQRAIPLFEPLAHFRKGLIREVKVPICRQVRDTTLVAEVVEKRPVGSVDAGARYQAVMDCLEPLWVRQTRVPLKGFLTRGIFRVELFGLFKFPIHRPIREPAMVFGVEVGGNILQIPAQIILQKVLRQILLRKVFR